MNSEYKNYLDGVVASLGVIGDTPSDVIVCTICKQFQVHKGLYALADSVGMSEHIAMEPRNSEEYPYESSFFYRGIAFYQIGKTEVDSYE